MRIKMNRVEQIRRHTLYLEANEQIEQAELDRIYCGHSQAHFLDVARIMYIRNLEQGLGIRKEIIYATALLHDIGRAKEYTMGIPHDEASMLMAEQILPECDFDKEEISQIVDAIGNHRNKAESVEITDEQKAGEESCLAILLKEADNLSRTCYSCKAQETCKWDEERKNNALFI